MDDRRAHIVADGVHACVVALAQGLVELGTSSPPRRGRPRGRPRLSAPATTSLQFFSPPTWTARAHRAVERFDDLVAVTLFGGDEHAHWTDASP